MAPKYVLSYFNVTGLAEPIRFLFAYGNIEYEDVRFEREDWAKHKPDTPFGKCPTLKVDDKQVHQSGAICRYLAKQIGGLSGKTDWDALEIDIIVDTITDFRTNYTNYFREENEEVKAKKLDAIKNEHNPYYLGKFDDIVKKNDGYFVNGQLTWADIYFAAISELLSNLLKEDILASYPNLKAATEKVFEIPSIKSYREKRPKTIL